MSASREKKLRQEQAANGYVDPKIIREQEQRKAEKKSRLLYGSIALVFVIVAAVLFIWQSGMIQRNVTALTIDDEKYTAADVGYYKYSMYSQYYYYYQQMYGDGSYVQYFLTPDQLQEETVKQMTHTQYVYEEAIKNGYKLTDDDKQQMDDIWANLEKSAKSAGYSSKDYLKVLYGNTMTKKAYMRNLEKAVIAANYASQIEDSFTYTDADLDKYYSENKNAFRYCAYEYFFISSNPTVEKDADGNAIEPTADEKAAAVKAAKDLADDVLKRIQNGEELKTVGEELKDKGSYSTFDSASYSSGAVMDWLFDESRKEGDSTVIEVTETGYYVVLFHSCERYEYNTVDVRHILVQVDQSGLDSTSESYEADLKALQDEAKAEAEAILNEWKNGAASEESFAALADEKSDDSPEGGLYERVVKGQMVEEFEDWCFEEGRKKGDTGLVLTPYGYHVMYFVGENDAYWAIQVENTLRSNDYDSWYTSLAGEPEVTEGRGMEYVVSFY